MDSKNHYKLSYFPMLGKAEFIRIALVYGKCDWEDVEIKREDFDSGFKDKTPCGKLPVLEVNGGPMMDNTLSLLRFVCMKEGMYSKNITDSY
jgi:glutathione S-transferase